jgi:hypothetical protein
MDKETARLTAEVAALRNHVAALEKQLGVIAGRVPLAGLRDEHGNIKNLRNFNGEVPRGYTRRHFPKIEQALAKSKGVPFANAVRYTPSGSRWQTNFHGVIVPSEDAGRVAALAQELETGGL